MSRTWTDAEEQWLTEHYDDHDSVNDVVAAFVEKFGATHTKLALSQKAHKLGLSRHDRSHSFERNRPAAVRMRWSDPKNADKMAWMLEHDTTESVYPTIDKFEDEFGIRLTRCQVTLFRQLHGQLKRPARHKGGRVPLPVGTELERKDGYLYVKVRTEPDRPGTRDNWEPKHHVVYKAHHGEIPEGCCVYFADRDTRNFDPENLVAVPREYVSMLNNPDLPDYHDAESLKACMAWIDLHRAIRDAESSKPRRCEVCGQMFTEDERQRSYPHRAQTCRACLDKGLKARGNRKPKGKAVCAVCGATFRKEREPQRRCRACIDAAPKWSADNQKQSKRR